MTDNLTTKSVQKDLKKGDYNFSYDGIPDWEKESSANKSKNEGHKNWEHHTSYVISLLLDFKVFSLLKSQ